MLGAQIVLFSLTSQTRPLLQQIYCGKFSFIRTNLLYYLLLAIYNIRENREL